MSEKKGKKLIDNDIEKSVVGGVRKSIEKRDRYKNETPDQASAFEIYYRMGDGRTMPKLKEKLDEVGIVRSVRTLYEWSYRYNWAERIAQWNIEISRDMEEKAIKEIVDEKANYRRIVKVAIGQFVKKMQEEKIDIARITDLERLIKLDLLLMGEHNESSKVEEVKTTMNEEDRRVLKEFSKSIEREFEDI